MQPTWLEIIGLGLLVLALTAYMRPRGQLRVLWDENNSIMVLVRTWTIEVCGGCLLTSVPLSLDLTHSARQVLRAMSAHDEEHRLGGLEVRFFMTRPLGQGPTRLGMMAVRAYPHTPIQRADLRDMALVNAGGFDVIAA
jgi:hypothetical protein